MKSFISEVVFVVSQQIEFNHLCLPAYWSERKEMFLNIALSNQACKEIDYNEQPANGSAAQLACDSSSGLRPLSLVLKGVIFAVATCVILGMAKLTNMCDMLLTTDWMLCLILFVSNVNYQLYVVSNVHVNE